MAFSAVKKEIVQAYSKVNRDSERATRKFITNTVFNCAGGAIYWRSNQQSSVARSSKKSEFVALSFRVKDMLWW